MQALLTQFKAIAEPTRLRLLNICARGELSVSEITRVLGQSQPRVSRHLKLLCDAGLLDRFREQHWVLYRLASRGDGARVARQVLELLPEDSPELERDRERIHELLTERDQMVSRIMDSHPSQLDAVAAIETHAERIDDAVLSLLGSHAPGDLLDIGTGSGRMLALLAEKARHAVGIDISRDMLLVARSNLQAAGLQHASVRQGDMYRLRFPAQSFDTVSMDLVLSLAERPERVVAEATRVLKPGGALLIVDFAGDEAGLAPRALEGWLAEAGLGLPRFEAVAVGSHQLGLWLAQAGNDNDAEQAA